MVEPKDITTTAQGALTLTMLRLIGLLRIHAQADECRRENEAADVKRRKRDRIVPVEYSHGRAIKVTPYIVHPELDVIKGKFPK